MSQERAILSTKTEYTEGISLYLYPICVSQFVYTTYVHAIMCNVMCVNATNV